MSSLLKWTRDKALTRMQTFEEMPRDVVLRARKPKEVQSEIDAALARLGVCALVLPAVPNKAYDSSEVLFFPELELRVRLIENTLLNKTNTDIYELMEIVMKSLHGWMPEGAGWEEPMHLSSKPVHLLEFPGERVMDLIFIFASHLVTPAN